MMDQARCSQLLKTACRRWRPPLEVEFGFGDEVDTWPSCLVMPADLRQLMRTSWPKNAHFLGQWDCEMIGISTEYFTADPMEAAKDRGCDFSSLAHQGLLKIAAGNGNPIVLDLRECSLPASILHWDWPAEDSDARSDMVKLSGSLQELLEAVARDDPLPFDHYEAKNGIRD